jgi:hypothetical protein
MTHPFAQDPIEMTHRGSGIWSYTALPSAAPYAAVARHARTLSERWRHLVGQSPRDNHDIALPRTGSEDDTQAVLVVSGGSHMPKE